MIWYYKILANRPCLIISTIGTVATSCLIISIYTNTFPNFTDPAMGFEARGTDVGIRLNTWYNLESECRPSGRLVSDPMQLEVSRNHIYKNPLINETNKKRKKKKKFHKYNHKTANTFYEKGVPNFKQRITETSFNSNSSNHLNFKAKKNKSEHNFFGNLKSATKIGEFDKYFCDSPRKMYAHFVVERISSNHLKSLFDVDSFLSICELQDRVTNVKNYEEYCEIDAATNSCCRPWSLPNYAALVANKTSCFELKVEDVLLLKKIWTFCKEFYYGIKVNRQCNDDILCGAPPECMHNDLYIAFEYLTDVDFLNSNISENMFLKYSMIFVPVIKDPKILSLYYEWQKADLKTDKVKIIGMDLGLENDLFNDLLINDCWLLAIGAVIIFTSMWLYTNSLFVTVMSSIAVCFSLGLSYFIYTIVFGMVFFPYLNLLAVVVIIGIGADDAFVFIRIWQCNKLHLDDVSQSSFVKLLALTFHQATSSMFVTSMTTAFAFFASYTSNITSIKCFGLFAGTAVFTNFLLMITWLPASIAMMEQIFKSRSITMRQPRKIIEFLKEQNSKLFEKFSKIVKILVIKYSCIWINLFAVLGVLSFIIVFYWPGFKLPINHIFQPFSSQHPFQLYNTKLKKEFAFENAEMVYESFKMPLRFVWGVLPIDDGDYTDPSSRGSLQYDNNFDMNTIQSQMWLLKFCQNLRQQWFTELKTGQLQSDCFLENFISIMNRKYS